MSVASTKTCNSHVGPIVGALEQTHTGEEKILSHTLVKYCKRRVCRTQDLRCCSLHLQAATPLRTLSAALHSLRQNFVRPAQHELPGQGRQITQCLPQKLLRVDLSLNLIDHTAHLLQAHSCCLSTRQPQIKPVSTDALTHTPLCFTTST